MQTQKALKLNGSKNLQNGGKFADEFYVSFVKKNFFPKKLPESPENCLFLPQW